MKGGMKQQQLLDWFDKNRRPLPWRSKNPDPYQVWLSEIMLQQTQVTTMLSCYRRFLKTFPTVTHLARGEIEDVLKLWSGLGYYSRARHFHRAAKIVVGDYGGKIPDTKEELLKLPGIGEYTAGAIASIAFGERVPVVDGNVIRVLTRVFALRGDFKKEPLKSKLWKIAETLLPEEGVGDFNQALMELGALVCLPKNPVCPVCPIALCCKARQQNRMESYPTPQKKSAIQKVVLSAALIEKNGHFLLARRNSRRHLQSMWEFPQTEPSYLGLKVLKKGALPVVRHAIMNQSIRMLPCAYHFRSGEPTVNKRYVAYRWIRADELKKFPTSSLNHKILKNISSPKTRARPKIRKEASAD